jgi:hypothetical protein
MVESGSIILEHLCPIREATDYMRDDVREMKQRVGIERRLDPTDA